MVWSVVKPNTTPTSPVEPQNPSNFSEVACKSKVKRGGGGGPKPALDIFLDIVGAFDNVTFGSFVAALQGLGNEHVLGSHLMDRDSIKTSHSPSRIIW